MMESAYQIFKKGHSFFNTLTVFAMVSLLGIRIANAQDYQRKINWLQNPKTFSTLDAKTVVQPSFANAVHLEQSGLLPYYKEIIPITIAGDISIQIVNPVYSVAGHLDNSSQKYVKENVEAKGELSFYKKQPRAYISFLPFRKNPTTGGIEKLESFTLKVRVTPKIQKRSINSYASNSVLASGSWYKVAVNADGIYKIDYNFIKNTLGIDPNNVSLNKLAIFGNGGGMVPDLNSVARPDDLMENPTMLSDNNNNNKFDQDDYLLFYGEMPDAWQFNSTTQSFSHTKNLYSDTTYYFLTTDAGSGKRVSLSSSVGNPNKTITDFDERAFHESDQYNFLQSGKAWLGDKMTGFSTSQSFSYNFPNLITSVPIKLTSLLAANTNSHNGGSTTTVSINTQTVITHTDPGIDGNNTYPPASIPLLKTENYSATSNQINLVYSFNPNPADATAAAYIDYFELNLKRALTLSSNFMSFRNISSIGAGNLSNFILNNASSLTKVWDVTNLDNIKEMQSALNGSQLSFTTSTDVLKEFIAFNVNSSFVNPEYVGKVENQNLHAISQPNMVIVAYDDFIAPSNELADFHRKNDNITVSVVKLSQVYNEFGSGKPDISAIRDFVKMLYDKANGDTAKMPRYLLLMGDGSFDCKNRVANNNNFISTYQSTESNYPTGTFVSDDFFGLLDANEGGNIADPTQMLDVAVGRLPVESEQEGWDVVNKIKNYKKPQPSTACAQASSNNSWRNSITFIGDDEDGDVHLDASDGLAETTRSRQPAYNYEKIYLDAFKQISTPAGDRYPDVNTAIINKVNSGTLIVNWVGHGGPTNWAHERVFNMSDITQLQNNERLPLFITATCDFSAYDLPDRTAGEWLIINPKGGAIASITTTRLVYSNANQVLDQETFDYLFKTIGGNYLKLGEVTMLAKNTAGTDITNTRKFTLLGDPALQLNYPRYNVATTYVNNKPVALPHDTLKALSQVTIKGEIRDDNGSKLTSFSGVIYPLVYDKISTMQTLGNDGSSPVRSFLMYKNILFKGKASVTNGDFSFTFIVPKDINYQYGNGRLSYYADNGNYIDAHGYSTDIVIGGTSDSAKTDNIGPKMNIYMNDEKFVFGGITDANPLLLVKLQDESGINTVSNGIGHDLTAILDDNHQNKIVLNDYYESELDNFQKGAVRYPLSKLSNGMHNLKLKAWDIYNNSSEGYLEFVVTSNAKLALNHVYNYPNPFTTHTEFMFEENKPCDNLDVSIQIYSVGGKLVKSISQQMVHCEGYRVDNIVWDGLDDYGDPIAKGVYIYKLNVRDSSGDSAHKFEKLVVLR